MNQRKHIYTTAELFRITMRQLKEEGKVPEELLEYAIPASDEKPMKNYEFDVLGTVSYGANEGIYLSLFYSGDIGEKSIKIGNPDRSTGKIGTIKTLSRSDDAFLKMATLMANFQIAASRFVENHLDDFNRTGFDVDYYKEGETESHYGFTYKGLSSMAEASKKALQTLCQTSGHPYVRAIVTDNESRKATEVKICKHCISGDCDFEQGACPCKRGDL